MNYKILIAAGVILLSGYAIGRYTVPAKVVTKTVTQTVTQVVTKTVEVDKTDYYKNKILIETVTTKPDGTVIRKREFIDKSIINHDDQTDTNTASNSSSSTTNESSKTYSSEKGSVNALVARNLHHLSEDIYGLQVSKKLIGPFSVGAFGLTDETLGLSLGVNF